MLIPMRGRWQQAPRPWGRNQERDRRTGPSEMRAPEGPASWPSIPWPLGVFTLLVAIFLGACASQQAEQPSVPAFNYAALTTTLHRGISTAADVKAALGEPQGSGGFLYPTDTEEQTLWFYEKLKVNTSGGKMDIQQDMLLVFFKAARFDGFLWFSDARKDW